MIPKSKIIERELLRFKRFVVEEQKAAEFESALNLPVFNKPQTRLLKLGFEAILNVVSKDPEGKQLIEDSIQQVAEAIKKVDVGIKDIKAKVDTEGRNGTDPIVPLDLLYLVAAKYQEDVVEVINSLVNNREILLNAINKNTATKASINIDTTTHLYKELKKQGMRNGTVIGSYERILGIILGATFTEKGKSGDLVLFDDSKTFEVKNLTNKVFSVALPAGCIMLAVDEHPGKFDVYIFHTQDEINHFTYVVQGKGDNPGALKGGNRAKFRRDLLGNIPSATSDNADKEQEQEQGEKEEVAPPPTTSDSPLH